MPAARRAGKVVATAMLAVATFAAGATAPADAATTKSQNGNRAQVRAAGGLRVRSGPGLRFTTKTVMRNGTRVRVVGGPVRQNGYAWYKVTGFNSRGTVGWSAGNWLGRPGSASASRSTRRSTATVGRFRTGASYQVHATGYNGAEFNSKGIMRNGRRVHWGAVATDPRYIPLGTKMYISGFGNKVFVAEDTGNLIKGWDVDIWFPTLRQAREFGSQRRTITIIR